MTTTTKTIDYRRMLNNGDPANIPDIFRQAKLGNMLQPIKVTFAALTAADLLDITTAAAKSKITGLVGMTLDSDEMLPPIGSLLSCRIVAGGATHVGSYAFTDAGGTAIVPPGGASAAVGIAKLSDDGKTITWAAGAQVTGLVLMYTPRSLKNMGDVWPTVP